MSTSEHRNVEANGPLVQRITTDKGSESVDKQNPQRGTQSATARILLSNAV